MAIAGIYKKTTAAQWLKLDDVGIAVGYSKKWETPFHKPTIWKRHWMALDGPNYMVAPPSDKFIHKMLSTPL